MSERLTAAREWLLHRAAVIALALVLVATFAQSYNGRRDVVASQRRACVRGISDRVANRSAWYAAYQRASNQARLETGRKAGIDRKAALTYWQTAWSLNHRVDATHTLRDSVGREPLGPGLLDCDRVFPPASPLQFFG